MRQLSSSACFGGAVRKYEHESSTLSTKMRFSVFLPSMALAGANVPALYFLSGLTCNEDNFITKAGAQRMAEKHGLALICPDTSPRGEHVPVGDGSWDFGLGAGFYVDATVPPFSSNYKMYSYVTKELPQLVESMLPVNDKRSICGHSMGGHGALICYLKNPGMYSSVSAFAPICHPSACPWGVKAFTGYLGTDMKDWQDYDAVALMGSYSGPKGKILIDQGTEDDFLRKRQLLPEDLENAARAAHHPIEIRHQPGYDHSYYFIATFVEDHISHHSAALNTTRGA